MIVARQRATGVFDFSQSYLTTYAALIFPFDSAQHIWTDHDFNLHHPQPSFVETSCSSQIPLLHWKTSVMFLWNQALAKVRKIFPHWDKRNLLCGNRKDVLYVGWEGRTTSSMLNEFLFPFVSLH